MKDTRSIDEILGDFSSMPETKDKIIDGGMIGIWLPAEYKAGYDKLQEKSGRKFGKKAREALIALIDAAQARTA